MSREPRDILSSLTDEIGRRILDVIGGDKVLSIFLSGSVAKNESASHETSGVVEIYSDLDVFTVVDEDVDIQGVRRRLKALALELPLAGEDFRVFPTPDIGVFSLSDFIAQPARPGTVDISAAHRLVYGRGDIPRMAERLSESGIDIIEALYLIENRLIEMADVLDQIGRGGSHGDRRYVRYVILKGGLDAVTAILIVLARYNASRDARIAELANPRTRSQIRALVSERSLAHIDLCCSSALDLPRIFRESDEAFDGFRAETDDMLLDVWMSIARRIHRGEDSDWKGLIAWRCRYGARRRNLRELAVLGRRLPVSPLSLAAGVFKLLRYSPGDVLRMSGLVETLTRRGEGAYRGTVDPSYNEILDRLTRSFNHTRGTLFQRARAMHREAS
jgi:hypothetical protein